MLQARPYVRTAVLVLVALIPFVGGARASPGPAPSLASGSGFLSSEVVAGEIPVPTDFAFAPDGRIFVATKGGAVRVIKNGQLLPDPFVTVPANDYYERGLMGLTLDPAFETNGYIYLYYTYEHDPDTGQSASPRTGRLSRLTAGGHTAVPGSEVVLLGTVGADAAHPACQDFAPGADCLPADGLSHIGGGLEFAPDGTLFVSTGDASFFTPNYEVLMQRVQDLDSLAGKVLRIKPDGAAPSDNPFFTGDATANRSKVWALGFRNPFRLTVQAETGLPFIGDVGSAFGEEIDVGSPGGNFGWPCYEGGGPNPVHSAFAYCQAFYAAGTPTVHPLYSYPIPRFGSAAIVGGVFYHGSGYSPEYQDAFFFGDWARGSVSVLKVNASNKLVPDSVQTALTEAGQPVAFELGPDGDVYYLTLDPTTGLGEVRRIVLSAGNRPPVARASASPRGGLAPLTVRFDAAGSSDPDKEPLTYLWDFDDGTLSTAVSPAHTFAAAGAYTVRLTVADPAQETGQKLLEIVAGDEPPRAAIASPAARAVYAPLQPLVFDGLGIDAEDGQLHAGGLRWTVLLHHCHLGTLDCHTHLYYDGPGAQVTVIAPDQGDELMYLEVSLTATDSSSLTGAASVTAGPDSDGDGLLDHEEALITATDRLDPDSDDDGMLDGAEDADGDGCSAAREIGPDEGRGGRRDPANPWDFYDISGDGAVGVFDDMLAVVSAYGEAPGPPYVAAYDRSPAPPVGDPWDLGPPDGVINVLTDIIGVAAQFGHNCRT